MRRIKLYEQFVDQLNELNAKPYFWRWNTNKTATFESIDDSFKVIFTPNNEDNTYTATYESKKYGTNKSGPGSIGNAMRVLATVMDIIIAFLDGNEEYDVEFAGDKEEDEKDGPTKRDRIYKMMMQDLPDNYKWEIASDNKKIHISRNLVHENATNQDYSTFYHGSTDKNLTGHKGLHVGTREAAKEALEARIGVPAEGEWDGTREYGKTLLAGKDRMDKIEKEEHRYVCSGFNCGRDVPNEDYYPTDRKEKATYSDESEIPMNCKPIIFPVKITGHMTNTPQSPLSDGKANGLMGRSLRAGNAKSGFYYKNIGEDEGSISAVVPDKSFLKEI